MPFKKLLIANRGEIAIRIARAAGEAGLATVAIYPADDALSLHVRTADEAHEIPGRGARAYLGIAGGIDVPSVLGSRATDRTAGFGGLALTVLIPVIDPGLFIAAGGERVVDLLAGKVAERVNGHKASPNPKY